MRAPLLGKLCDFTSGLAQSGYSVRRKSYRLDAMDLRSDPSLIRQSDLSCVSKNRIRCTCKNDSLVPVTEAVTRPTSHLPRLISSKT